MVSIGCRRWRGGACCRSHQTNRQTARILGVYNAKKGLSGLVDLQASLGVGLHAGGAKFYCYPGAGQIEINPRALVDDAVSYISKMNAGPSSED